MVEGFAYSTEENLADAVVDIRLIDQQKQNVELSETVERLTDELNNLRNAANEEMSRERQSHEEQMASLQSKIQETEKSLAMTKTNLEQLSVVNEERKSELEKMKRSLEASVGKRDELQSKLTHLETEWKKTTEILQSKTSEVVAAQEANALLQSQLIEANAQIVKAEGTLKTTSDLVKTLLKEKADLADRLREAEQLIVALNGEIIEAQHEVTQQKQIVDQKQSKIEQSARLIAQVTDEKCQLEKDNLSLAHARAKAEEKINELCDQVAVQNNQLEQQHTESARKLEICAQERVDLKSKLSATENELTVAEETVQVKSGEIFQLKQDIALMGVKYATEMQDQQSKRAEALAEIELLRTNIGELQSELAASIKLQATISDQMDILVKEKSVLEEKAKEADATIHALNDELAAAERAAESEQAKTSECEAENKRLAEAVEQMTDEKNKIEDDICRMNQLRSEAEEKIEALDAKVAELLTEKEELSKTIEMNASEHSTLNVKVQELTQASVGAEQRFVTELKTAEDRIKELNDVSICFPPIDDKLTPKIFQFSRPLKSSRSIQSN